MLPATFEWHALAELVTAAVLVAVVFPKSQSLYRRFTQSPVAPPAYSAPDFAYAASAVLRPGEVSTLHHGDESQEPESDLIPTMLRRFEELSLSDNESGGGTTEATLSPPSSGNDSSPCTASTSLPASQAGIASAHSVRFAPSNVKPHRSPSEGPSSLSPNYTPLNTAKPFSWAVHQPDMHMSQFEPISLPPPPLRLATTPALRSASVPPNEFLSPLAGDVVNAAFTSASASIAPPSKGKGKAKGNTKLQSSASVSSRALSTPPPPVNAQGRPITRSMSAAPAPFSSTGTPALESIDKNANPIDELPVDSYLRHHTKRAAWFESQSAILIAHPPDFSSRSDIELEDVFINRVQETYQLWIWEKDNTGKAVWKRIWLGYARPSDGRKLTVTPVRKEPSWVSEQWASKTAKKRAP